MARRPLDLPAFNAIEREVLILDSVWGLANDLVNRHNVTIYMDDGNGDMHFNSMECSRLFSILLVDLLSNPSGAVVQNKDDYLKALIDVCEAPSFDRAHDIDELCEVVTSFNDWLEFGVIYKKMWLPSIRRECDIHMSRKEALKIVGNFSKHNFTRLTVCAGDLMRYLGRTNIHATPTEAMMLLDDFEIQFYDDVFHCYRNMLAFHINNLRRGMRNYLMRKCHESLARNTQDLAYFIPPPEITNNYVAEVFCRLMGRVTRNHMYGAFGVAPIFRDMF